MLIDVMDFCLLKNNILTELFNNVKTGIHCFGIMYKVSQVHGQQCIACFQSLAVIYNE